MPLKKLIVVRHGKYDMFDGILTATGRQQITNLGETLARELKDLKVVILSSNATRAVQTTQILSKALGDAPYEKHDFLFSGGGSFRNNQENKAATLIGDKGVTHDVVILSSHMEFIDLFPTVWGRHHGFSIPEQRDTSKGSARIIDMETKTCKELQF